MNRESFNNGIIVILGVTSFRAMEIENSITEKFPSLEDMCYSFEDYEQYYSFIKSGKKISMLLVEEGYNNITIDNLIDETKRFQESKYVKAVIYSDDNNNFQSKLTLKKNKDVIANLNIKELSDPFIERILLGLSNLLLEAIEADIVSSEMANLYTSIIGNSMDSIQEKIRIFNILSTDLKLDTLNKIAIKWWPVYSHLQKNNLAVIKANKELYELCSKLNVVKDKTLLEILDSKMELSAKFLSVVHKIHQSFEDGVWDNTIEEIRNNYRPLKKGLYKIVLNRSDQLFEISQLRRVA